ncbi:hypothetical protein FN976_26715 [Caenimonas sedimenti]|uniref:Spore coat protein U domain-containing protein n=1 Tax=Caenimonas sedimenti TaxID=2596921 RepID=A0A562ZFU2_9BURK|nr:hypothetical protein [Caenimonas sedimenti]TWO66140.1 hypothetical protein FN976_26715 [Caenimonas sedimenti]
MAFLALSLAGVPASGLVLYFDGSGQRSITLRVGSNDAIVNNVTFDVLNADVAPTPTPVTGVAGNGAPAVNPAGGVLFVVSTNRRGGGADVVRLTANSSAGLTCSSGVCLGAGITIPFSTISWTSYEILGGGFASGIPSGTFTGAAAQTLFTNTVPAGNDSLIATNVLLFQYANTTLYPSGTYTGRVTYTLTVP